MPSLLLDPHGDDSALFAAYTVLKEPCYVAVIYPTVPEEEINAGLRELGAFRVFAPETMDWDLVYAPAFHEDGHYEHNQVSRDATELFPKVRYYATYAPRGVRTHTKKEVRAEPWMVEKKTRALSCFVSQIEQESTRPWFTSLLDLREWYAT